jgi:hypothetical protein
LQPKTTVATHISHAAENGLEGKGSSARAAALEPCAHWLQSLKPQSGESLSR